MTDSRYPIQTDPDTYEQTILPEDEAAGSLSAGLANGQVIRSVGLNTFYQVGAQVAPAVTAILAIPFLLRHLGPEGFGIVTLFSTALIYFTMLDLGLGRAATRFIAQSLEAGDADEVRRYFWGSIFLLTAIGLVVSSLCLLCVPALVSHFLKVSPAYYQPSVRSFYLICLAIPLVTLTATLRGTLEASGRFLFVSLVTGCSGVGLYLLPVLAVMAGGGIVSIAITYIAIRIGMGAAFALGCLSINERPSFRCVLDLSAIKKMLSFGGWLSVSNIIGCALLYGDRFLLGACIGMAAVAGYSVPMDVISRMQILVNSFCAVLFPLMSRLDQSQSPQFQSVYRGALGVGISIMTTLSTCITLLAPYLMSLWLRARNTSDAVFAAQVFLAGAVVQTTASIAFTALHARGRSDLAAWLHMAEFPVYCAVFYWAAVRFGVKGAALAWLGRVVIDFIGMVVLLRLHAKDGTSFMQPELIAPLISLGVLVIMMLPGREAIVAACVICILTWFWTWRVLLDRQMQTPIVRALWGWRER